MTIPTISKVKDIDCYPNYGVVNIALAVESYQGSLYGVSRTMPVNDYYNSQLTLHKLDDSFTIQSSETLVAGEDPRLFIYKDQLHLISWTFNHSKQDLDIFMYNIVTRTKTILNNPDLKHNGKNWVAYVYNSELYFIYSLEPLIILKYVEPDLVKVYYSNANPNNGIGNIRAGSPCKLIQDRLCLFSRTGTPNPHIIHFTTINPTTFETVTYCLEPDRKSGVHDPYGFFEHNNRLYISTTESDNLWHNGNCHWFRNSIYEVKL